MLATTDLRPLGLGQILDHAVTLLVRNFPVLAAAVAVAYVPFSVVQWRLVPWVAENKTRLTRGEWTSWAIDLALGAIVFGLARTAVAALAHARYMGYPLSLRAAYQLAVLRLGAQVFAQVVSGVIAFAVLFVLALPVIFIAFGTTAGGSRGTVTIIATAVIAGAIALVLGTWLFLAVELATVRIGTGTTASYTAVFSTLRATAFRRPWHSLLAALVLMLVLFGGALLFSGLAQLMPTAGLRAFVTFGVGSACQIAIEAFSVAFLVVYDVDLAVRHHGLDLAIALDGSAASERTLTALRG